MNISLIEDAGDYVAEIEEAVAPGNDLTRRICTEIAQKFVYGRTLVLVG